MAPQTIAIIGALDADLIMIAPRIPGPGESLPASEYIEALGGKGANCAIATHRTCHKRTVERLSLPDNDSIDVKMIGAVGDDQYRDKFIVELNKNGIDTSGIVTAPKTRSSVWFVKVEHSTRENRCLFSLGATASWKKEHFSSPEQLGGGPGKQLPDLVVAQMEIAKDVVEAMIETAGKAGIDFCLNAAPATPIDKRFYPHITHLLVNEDSWPTIAEEFLNRGVKNVVITLGAKGVFYANAKGSGHCPAYEVVVKDTTGAGDTFTGAYSSDYLRQKAKGTWDINSAVVRANKAAAMAIRSVGAQNGIPWADEIDGFDASLKAPSK